MKTTKIKYQKQLELLEIHIKNTCGTEEVGLKFPFEAVYVSNINDLKKVL